jgi:polyribonucleotide nucleotidyltransferase
VGGHYFGLLGQGFSPDAVVVKVPVRAVGMLMGPKGARMRELRETTGARVMLAKVGGQ